MKEKIRFIELDGLRGIAVFLVMLSHYTWAYDFHFHSLNENFFHFIYGDFGVQLFFIISGFVIFMTLDYTKNLSQFIISRFSRLYPTYWISLIITLLFLNFLSIPSLSVPALNTILMNFTMLQYYFKFAHIDQVYWSLAVELMFYIIMGILFLFKQLKHIELYSLGWLFISLISVCFDFFGENYIKVLLILEYAPLFIAGLMLYKIKYKKSSFLNHVILFLSLILYLIILHFQIIERHQVNETVCHYLLIISAYLVFYFLAFKELKILQIKCLLFLGYISYPLYLLHNVIGYTLIYRLKMFCDNQLFYVPITMFVVISLSYFVTKTIENPTKQLKLKLKSIFGKE